MAPARPPPSNLEELETLETSLTLPHFTADDAWTLGCMLRERLITDYTLPTVITITTPSSSPTTPQLLFHTCTRPGTTPDNDIWVSRKTRTVLRFGTSSYRQGVKHQHDEALFATKFGLGPEEAGGYAIHGGAVPVRVEGVVGCVAVVVVSGLKQEEDHMVVVEGLEALREYMAAKV